MLGSGPAVGAAGSGSGESWVRPAFGRNPDRDRRAPLWAFGDLQAASERPRPSLRAGQADVPITRRCEALGGVEAATVVCYLEPQAVAVAANAPDVRGLGDSCPSSGHIRDMLHSVKYANPAWKIEAPAGIEPA